jgi:hypothetical protein
VLTGCSLRFGADVTTTHPTEDQVARCRAAVFLQTNLAIQVHGMKWLGSGMDDALWLKFSCAATDPAEIFRTDVVDVSRLRKGFKHASYQEIPGWWDVDGRDLSGGQFELPDARFMNIGIDAGATNATVYVIWQET